MGDTSQQLGNEFSVHRGVLQSVNNKEQSSVLQQHTQGNSVVPMHRDRDDLGLSPLLVHRNALLIHPPLHRSGVPVSVHDVPVSVHDVPVSVHDMPVSVPNVPVSVHNMPVAVNMGDVAIRDGSHFSAAMQYAAVANSNASVAMGRYFGLQQEGHSSAEMR
jgi:hypothetical protein